MEKYFYLDANGQQLGPVSPELFTSLGVNANTMVWKKGMANWVMASQIPELSVYLGAGTMRTVPPTPPGGGTTSGGNGSTYTSPGKPVMPDNNIVWGVLVTFFCCLPLGVYSIIQGSKVSSLYAAGNYAEALAMSEDAKKWAIWGAGIGLAVQLLGLLIMALSS